MRIAAVAGLAATAFVFAIVAVVAGAATRFAAGCIPAYEYCDPGQLPAGVYTTRYFLSGMRVDVPGRGWTSQQDSTTEFNLSPPGYPDPNTAPVIRFWIDPRVSTPCSDKVLPINISTPARAVRWIRTNRNFIASAPKQTTIAGHLSALTVDYDVSPSAPRCDPSCPGPCIDYFLFFGGTAPDATDLAPTHTPGVKDGFGTGTHDPVRLYFAHIGPPSHLFVVGVETPNGNGMAKVRAAAARMLAHLRLPARLPPKHG
jgi:hypothetical protein